jgi:hypothetical protein
MVFPTRKNDDSSFLDSEDFYGNEKIEKLPRNRINQQSLNNFGRIQPKIRQEEGDTSMDGDESENIEADEHAMMIGTAAFMKVDIKSCGN